MNTVLYEEMTVLQLEKLKKQHAVMLLSFGSIEQHSTHLPVGTDYLCSLQRVTSIAKRTNSIVLAPIQLGYSFNHKGMSGTISLKAGTLIHIVTEILDQLCEHGWKRYMIFSGHAGNWSVLEVALQITREYYPDVQFVITRDYPTLTKEHTKKRFIKNFDYHAGKIETALVSYYFPSLLDYKNIPNGNTSLPKTILSHIQQCEIDDIDELLIKACTPQKTEMLSNNGIWGIQDPHEYLNIPVEEVMKNYENFYVELINRWNRWDELS